MAPSWLDFTNWVKVLLVFCGVMLALAIGLALFVAVTLGLFDFPPKDAKMIRTFTAHRTTFDRLVAMSDTDARYYRTGTFSPLRSVPPARRHVYLAALDTLHVAWGLEQRGSGDAATVTLTAWGEGFAGMGSEKGYVFSPTPPSALYSSLDNVRLLVPDANGYVYRAIAPNWYLFYDAY
jgi:hypothetical protein